jgi:pSer/pThr/pTyr-binding forkhead associated (FHA) protein
VAVATETLSLHDDDGPVGSSAAYLAVAFECAAPGAGASRYSLAGVDEVRVGRGDARSARRDGRVLHVEIPDAALSSPHLSLRGGDDGWTIADAGSKNGTFVNGVKIDKGPLADGDVIDAARTVLVFVDPGGELDPGDRTLGVDGDVRDTLDPELAATFATLDRIARSGVPVLILGETGTGKELVARAVHAGSARDGRYVAVNCGAVPDTLIESELFGHKKGAFSGATEDRPGLVRASDGGTLFLDEIGELSGEAQAALLRVLQEREVVPVGGHAALRVDLRVVAATCQDLPVLVELERFRRDLYARVAGFVVTLPPLRRRRADLGVLIGRLLARHAAGRAVRFDRASARALFLHEWPHNVRELEQAIAAAVAVADGEIRVAHLPEPVRAPRAPAPVAATPPEIDRPRLEALLGAHRGNVTRVAEALGTSRSQVRRLVARFGLSLDAYRT